MRPISRERRSDTAHNHAMATHTATHRLTVYSTNYSQRVRPTVRFNLTNNNAATRANTLTAQHLDLDSRNAERTRCSPRKWAGGTL